METVKRNKSKKCLNSPSVTQKFPNYISLLLTKCLEILPGSN